MTELSGEFRRQQRESRGDDEARSEHKARSLRWRPLGKGWDEEPAACVDRSCCHKTQAGNQTLRGHHLRTSANPHPSILLFICCHAYYA